MSTRRTRPPRRRASRARCTKWRLVATALIPHRITRSLSRARSGLGPGVEPRIAPQPASFAGEQMVRSRREAPMRWKKGIPAFRWTRPREPPAEQGRMASAPSAAMIIFQRAAISPTASSQLARRNSPAPFLPVRTSGWLSRSGEWTLRSYPTILGQREPCEYGCSGSPRTFTTWPSRTSARRPQASGQSNGQMERARSGIRPSYPVGGSPRSRGPKAGFPRWPKIRARSP